MIALVAETVHTSGINWESITTIIGSIVVIMSAVFTAIARYVTSKVTTAINDFRVDVIAKMDERLVKLEILADERARKWRLSYDKSHD
jgi:hypothetical protein